MEYGVEYLPLQKEPPVMQYSFACSSKESIYIDLLWLFLGKSWKSDGFMHSVLVSAIYLQYIVIYLNYEIKFYRVFLP